ncbi:MAG: DUF3822 family protein [Flavobacteriaceae bacterium]|nr:DUF3822 family protein [Flavobacteriaceae bacterium]
MTKNVIKNSTDNTVDKLYKLSIQVSLNGLSFCIFDTVANTITHSRRVDFKEELSPFDVQRELKALFLEEKITDYRFTEVVATHRNHLFSLVPRALFDENELANYLKFNAKILANDLIEYDELSSYDMMNVYVPFMNINNYIYELFGEFDFLHHGTVLIQALMNIHTGTAPVCYVHVTEQQLDIVVLTQKKLVFFNSFRYQTKEDFIYYILFTLEQLKLDTNTIKTRLFGAIETGDELYDICYEYIQNLSIFIPESDLYTEAEEQKESIDFTLINAL